MEKLKYLVIFLGILIVLGLGLLVYGIATKAGKLAEGPSTVDGATVPLPAEAKVVEMVSGENRLFVRVESVDGEQILIFDDKGRELGTITLDRQSK